MSEDIYFAKKSKGGKVKTQDEEGGRGMANLLNSLLPAAKYIEAKGKGGKFEMPTHTAPIGTPAGRGRKAKHVQEVMAGVNLPKHFHKYLTLCKKAVSGGALSAPDMKKLHDYTQLDGGGFFSSIWSGIKKVVGVAAPILAPVVGKLITPLLTPVLGPLAPVVGQMLPKLLGGTLTGQHVDEVARGENIQKHFKKFVSLARTVEKGGALTPKMAKVFDDYKHLNAGGFFDDAWKGLKKVGSKVMENLPAIIENAPKVIETAKKGYDFGKKLGLFG